MIDWPESLVPELADRRCIIVLGAGASAGCKPTAGTKTPPTWKQLLEILLQRVPGADDQKEVNRLIALEQFLDAAQIIRDKMPEADFNHIIRRELQDPNYSPSEVHELVLKLDPKIVITTNYDDIYERYSARGEAASAYNVWKYYDANTLDDVRSTRRLILKVHGSVSDTARIVLTRADYFKARRDARPFFELLDGLFLMSTLLFLGCGLSDPDIHLLLENANISVPCNHPHYAVVENVRHSSIKAAFKKTYNLDLLEYPAGKHAEIAASLKELNDGVQAYRLTHR